MSIRLRDVPQLARLRFNFRNHCTWQGVAAPCHLDTATGRLKIDAGWSLTGWCEKPPKEVMPSGRDGQIVIMFFHPEHGEIWQHYPLFDKDERDAAVVEGSLLCNLRTKGTT